MKTEALIEQLAAEAHPVRPLRPVWVRACLWLLAGLPPLFAIALIDGIRVPVSDLFGDGSRLIETAAILATALTAAIATLASTIPGSSRRWMLLPLAPLVIWLANVGEACVSDWVSFGPAGLLLRFDGPCFPAMAAMSIVPTAMILAMLRRGAPIHPRASLVLAALAIAALTDLGLRLIHGPDISIMALIWSFAIVAAISLTAKKWRWPPTR